MTFMTKFINLLIILTCIICSACNDYLNIPPKGSKIPTTLADFESPSLNRANYMWDESADRIMLNNSDEDTYYALYATISNCNLIVENAPTATEATDAERNEVIAYAKVIRSLCYDVLTNYYADTYDASTAEEKLSVPLITSANIDAPYKQVSIQYLYDFMLNDIKEAIEMGLPAQSMTAIHPNLGAGYALLARIYLQMQNYEEALRYSNLALDGTLFTKNIRPLLKTPITTTSSPPLCNMITWKTIIYATVDSQTTTAMNITFLQKEPHALKMEMPDSFHAGNLR